MSGCSVTTERLRLRVPTPGDASAILAIAGDPRTVHHNPSDLLNGLDQAEELLQRWIQHWTDHGFGYWCVHELGKPRTIGYCGLRFSTVHHLTVLNLIYRFAPDSWGRGYATEAAAAAVAWTAARHPETPVIARIRPENLDSQNVARKVGLRRDPDLDSQGDDGLDLAFTNRG